MLILDRFGGGGATALSGGVIYAGGGTPQQRAAGVTNSAGAMFGYLRTEVGDAVPAATLKEFCDGSVAMLAWLEGHGVPFEGSLCPDKTSYPSAVDGLYAAGLCSRSYVSGLSLADCVFAGRRAGRHAARAATAARPGRQLG